MYGLVLPIRLVPNGAIVTKVTGTKRYRVARSLPIYVKLDSKKNAEKIEVMALIDEDIHLLIPEDDGVTSINGMSGSAVVRVDFDNVEDLEEFLQEIEEGRPTPQ